MSTTPRENQLAEIREHIRKWHEDAAECRRRAQECQRTVSEHLAEAASSTEMAQRWEVIHDAVRFRQVPHLDVAADPDVATDTGEVPF